MTGLSIEKGRYMASWGLDLLSGRPEATAIIDGMIAYLANKASGE
jgi:hypothetical protein